MNSEMTDIEFCKEFSESISLDYKTSLEFITVNPDYSLLKFREVISSLCIKIAESQSIDLYTEKLFDWINILFEKGTIHKQFKDNLHEVRVLCNAGIHKGNYEVIPDDNKAFDATKRGLCRFQWVNYNTL